MNGDLYFDGKKYISAKRAAKISGYADDYIGQLCRFKKLESRMVGRSWFVSETSLVEYLNEQKHEADANSSSRDDKSKNAEFVYMEDKRPLFPDFSKKTAIPVVDEEKATGETKFDKSPLRKKNAGHNFRLMLRAGTAVAVLVLIAASLENFSFTKESYRNISSLPVNFLKEAISQIGSEKLADFRGRDENKILASIEKTPLYFEAGLRSSMDKIANAYHSFASGFNFVNDAFNFSVVQEEANSLLNKTKFALGGHSDLKYFSAAAETSLKEKSLSSINDFSLKIYNGTNDLFSGIKKYFSGFFGGRSELTNNEIIPIKPFGNETVQPPNPSLDDKKDAIARLTFGANANNSFSQASGDGKNSSDSADGFSLIEVKPDITRREVLDLIKQYDDNSKALIYASNAANGENSLTISQSVSGLEKRISNLQYINSRQLDKPASIVSRSDADIKNISGASIADSTITSSSFSGTTGTFSGNLSGTTATLSGLLTLNANLLMSASSYLNFGTDSGSSGYGIRDNSGTVQFKNSGGSWTAIAPSQWGNNGSDIYYTTGNVGIGTTSPYAKLSVVGETVSSYFTATSTTKSTFPYASTTALTVSGSAYLGSLNGPLQANNGLVSATTSIGIQYGGTGQTSFGQGWLNSNGTIMSASTSPTVNYIVATSTSATSTFPYLSVSNNSNLGTVVGGTWQGTAIGDGYLTKSGDWTGTFNGQNGAYYLSRANQTGTQGVSTLSNYDWTFLNNYGAINLTASSTKPLWAQGGINASSTSNFVYASTTALTISGNSYLGTISSGAWNGTAVSNQYGGTGIDSSALTGIAQIVSGAWSASSTLSVAYGGTGWNSIASGYIPFGNGAASLSTSTSFYWNNGNSRLGIGTTTPNSKLTIYDTSKAALEFSGAGDSTYKWTMGLDMADAGKFKIASSTALGTLDRFTIDGNGYIGIGTSTPGRRLDIADSGNNNPQMRLSRETNVYTDFSVAQTTGDLSLNLNGTNANNVYLYAQGNTGANLWVCEGGACPNVTLSDGGNIVVERDIKYPTSGRMKRTVVLTAAGAVIPTSGGATKTQVDGANSSYYVLDFGQTSTTSAFWQWTIPDSYDGGTISVTYYWFTTVTSGGVSWCSQTNGVNTAGDINAALSNATCDTTSNNVPTGAANTLATTTQSSISSNFHPGEAVTFKVSRGVDNTNDTAAANARLYMIKLKYGVATESD